MQPEQVAGRIVGDVENDLGQHGPENPLLQRDGRRRMVPQLVKVRSEFHQVVPFIGLPPRALRRCRLDSSFQIHDALQRLVPSGFELSGGQQQILEMAIALLLHPRLLMVDEPSLGLDPRMVEIVFDTILTINREGTTVLMVEQNAKKALSVSHRGFVLELGRNRFEGTGAALLNDPDVRQHYLGG